MIYPFPPDPFQPGGDFEFHDMYNPECSSCWGNHVAGEHSCGGLIHAILREQSGDNVYLSYCCDRCGCTDAPLE